MTRPGAFTPGHELSISHGVWSERVTEPMVQALVAGLLDVRGDLARFAPSVYVWAIAEARLLAITTALDDQGLVDGKGQPRAAWVDLEARYLRLAREARADLGLSPRSEADLARARVEAQSATFDLEAVIAKGREVIAARAIGSDNGNGDD